MVLESVSYLILSHVAVQFSQHHLLKRLSLPHCIFLPLLSKISFPWVHGFISGLSILFHWSLCLFLCQYHTVAGALSAGGSGSGWSTKRGRELSHVRGRGSGLECQAAMVQEWPRGATPRLRSGVAAERSYPASEVRGGNWEEQPQAQGYGQWPGGATTRPRSGGCVGAGRPRGAIPH